MQRRGNSEPSWCNNIAIDDAPSRSGGNYPEDFKPNFKLRVFPIDVRKYDIMGSAAPQVKCPVRVSINDLTDRHNRPISHMKELLFELELARDEIVKVENYTCAAGKLSRVIFEKAPPRQPGASRRNHGGGGNGVIRRAPHMYGLFQCDVCNFFFTRKDVLTNHIWTHMTNECDRCQARFVKDGDLASHQKIHPARRSSRRGRNGTAGPSRPKKPDVGVGETLLIAGNLNNDEPHQQLVFVGRDGIPITGNAISPRQVVFVGRDGIPATGHGSNGGARSGQQQSGIGGSNGAHRVNAGHGSNGGERSGQQQSGIGGGSQQQSGIGGGNGAHVNAGTGNAGLTGQQQRATRPANGELFQCGVCGIIMDKKKPLIKHVGKHMTHTCNHCPAKFVLKGDLLEHQKSHSADGNSMVVQSGGGGINTQAATNSGDGRPNQQPRSFESTGFVRSPNQCRFCYIQFDEEKVYIQHVNETHLIVPCKMCPIRFTDMPTMLDHQKLHRRGGMFHAELLIRNGRPVESPKRRRFVCDYCDSGFARKYNLRAHMRIHTGNLFRTFYY